MKHKLLAVLLALCSGNPVEGASQVFESRGDLPNGGTSVQFDPTSYLVDEGAGSVTLTITRTGDTSQISVVTYLTVDGSAVAESDYESRGATLMFKPGETSQLVSIPIINDSAIESNETFTVQLFPGEFGERTEARVDGVAPISIATVTITDNDGAPTPSPTPPTVQLANISGRSLVQTSARAGICGFIIQGGTGKQVILRGIGPSLSNGNPPIAGALTDPVLELYDSSANVIGSNDSWRSSQQALIQQSGLAPSDDREAAIIATLLPGAYTAIVRGSGSSSGVGLVEIYELQSTQGQLANVSVRGDVLTDNNVLINGVIIVGGAPKGILFRAIGPDLHNRNINGELQDPFLEVYDANGTLLGNNDNWATSTQAAQIMATGLQPNDTRESAVLLNLSAGRYTAIVRGVNNTTGIGLAEAYRLD